jgi:hypothetical protein
VGPASSGALSVPESVTVLGCGEELELHAAKARQLENTNKYRDLWGINRK